MRTGSKEKQTKKRGRRKVPSILSKLIPLKERVENMDIPLRKPRKKKVFVHVSGRAFKVRTD